MISRVSRDVRQLSKRNGRAILWAYECIGEFEVQRSRGSPSSMTCCKLPPSLDGSHFMDESQTQCTPVGDDTGTCQAQSPTKIYDHSPNCSNSGLSSGRQAPVKSSPC